MGKPADVQTLLSGNINDNLSLAIKYNEELIEDTSLLMMAYENVMRATMHTMQKHAPEYSHCWVWGVCEVSDLCYESPYFYYGAEEDKPKGFPEFKDVWVKGI